MISRYLIKCDVPHPDWPFCPVSVKCGSARSIGVVGLKSRYGITITGCSIRVTNADGVSLLKECVKTDGSWVATFPASHFQNYGSVKNGVVVFGVGKDETGTVQSWIERVGDLKVEAISASSVPGNPSLPRDVYHKSEVIAGVQHYKKETLVYSSNQEAWGAEYVGDYIFVGGDYVPYTTGA